MATGERARHAARRLAVAALLMAALALILLGGFVLLHPAGVNHRAIYGPVTMGLGMLLILVWGLLFRGAAAARVYARARALAKSGETDAAEREYRKVMVTSGPKLWSAAGIDLGRLRLTAGDLVEARALFEAVIRHSDDDLMRRKASYNLGTVFVRQDELSAAEFAFRWTLNCYRKDLVIVTINDLIRLLIRTDRQSEVPELVNHAESVTTGQSRS